MAESSRLSERITERLERHRHELAERQNVIAGAMKELLEQQERVSAVICRLVESVVRPRMEELARHFDNAAVTERHGDTDFHCVCQFTHTPRFPATVSFDIGLRPGENYTGVTARCDIGILPVLMEYKRDGEAFFLFDNPDKAIGLWVEERVIEFIDTYLRLETHPLYQKDNLVVDPVCGMQIPAVAAPSRVELPGHTFYFCSEVCKEAFLKEHNQINCKGGNLP